MQTKQCKHAHARLSAARGPTFLVPTWWTQSRYHRSVFGHLPAAGSRNLTAYSSNAALIGGNSTKPGTGHCGLIKACFFRRLVPWNTLVFGVSNWGAAHDFSGPFGGRALVGPFVDHTVCAVDPYGPYTTRKDHRQLQLQ